MAQNSAPNLTSPIKKNPFNNGVNANNKGATIRSNVVCPMKHKDCQSRSLAYCTYFKKLGVKARREVAKKLCICFIYLAKGHSATTCKTSKKCRFCTSLHHELLSASVRNAQNFLIGKITDSEEIGDVINDIDQGEDICVDMGDDFDYATYSTDIVESNQQVDDLIDLQGDGDNDGLEEDFDDDQIEGVDDDVEQFLFHSSSQEEADPFVYENWVLIHEPFVDQNRDSDLHDETNILFAAEAEPYPAFWGPYAKKSFEAPEIHTI